MSPKYLAIAVFLSAAYAAKGQALGAGPSPVPIGPSVMIVGQVAHSEDEERARLHSLPPSRIPLRSATLASAIRLLAESAQMSYLAPAESDFSERVTSDTTMNPFDLLEVLAETYNFGMEFHDGVWRFYRINLNELVSKVYTLRFSGSEEVKIHAGSINGQLQAASGGMNPTGGTGGGGAPMPSGGGGGSGEASFSVADPNTNQIIQNIKKILALPTTGLSMPGLDGSPVVPGENASLKSSTAPTVDPIWNPDTNELFVVATRQQHSLIASYLKTVDQPRKLVRIAVKFVETSRNPSSTVGVDWSNTFLGSGGPITLSGGTISTTATTASNAGTGTVTLSTGSSSSSTTSGVSPTNGTSTQSTNSLGIPINLSNPGGNIPLPISLLSVPQFQWTMQAIAADSQSSVVQDPVIFTSNNRPVSFKATTQEPIQEGQTTFGSATAASTSEIAYIDVGTELNVLPSVLPGDGPNKEVVVLNLAIDVSTIVGSQTIGGNPYPVTSSRSYSYSVTVPNGDTLAIAGLEQETRQTSDSKVPVLGDIPVLGYLFNSHTDSVLHTKLIAFITPEVIDSEGFGSAAPGGAPIPEFRHRVFQGTKSETLKDIDASLEGMPEDIEALRRCAGPENKEFVLNRLDSIDVELALIDVRLGELKLESDRITFPEAGRASRDAELVSSARAAVSKIGVVEIK